MRFSISRKLIENSIILLIVSCMVASYALEDYSNNDIRGNEILRQKRYINPFQGVINFFSSIFDMKRILGEQYQDTTNTLQKVYTVLEDQFSDTARTTQRPEMLQTITESSDPNATTSTTTEKYRISRQQLGVILNRNFRGLQKLLRIEIADAMNQSKYNIRDYNIEAGKAIAPFLEFKNFTKPEK